MKRKCAWALLVNPQIARHRNSPRRRFIAQASHRGTFGNRRDARSVVAPAAGRWEGASGGPREGLKNKAIGRFAAIEWSDEEMVSFMNGSGGPGSQGEGRSEPGQNGRVFRTERSSYRH